MGPRSCLVGGALGNFVCDSFERGLLTAFNACSWNLDANQEISSFVKGKIIQMLHDVTCTLSPSVRVVECEGVDCQ